MADGRGNELLKIRDVDERSCCNAIMQYLLYNSSSSSTHVTCCDMILQYSQMLVYKIYSKGIEPFYMLLHATILYLHTCYHDVVCAQYGTFYKTKKQDWKEYFADILSSFFNFH
jgi:hypothetical protein